ncbi:MAG: alpha/beta fold hydrolase [Betaproteobacteria bacterium]
MNIEAVVIDTGPHPAATVIWLHGLGADAHDFEPIVPELGLPASRPVRFIFPNAPERPVTINMGTPMRAWYDILQPGGGAEDEAGIRESQSLVAALVAGEVNRGIPHGKIALAGFSQGGAVVLQTALRQPERLAGVLALSTYLPLAPKLAAERHAANQQLPIFMAHGDYDSMIDMGRALLSRDALQELGYAVDWHAYPMAHSVCREEVADIAAFLLRIL